MLNQETKNESFSLRTEQIVDEMCLFDDTFMSKVFDGNIEATELLLQIVLEKDDIEVIEVIAQREFRGDFPDGRSIRLDILAKDSTGKLYDIEVQQENKGAIPKRARYHSSTLDRKSLKATQNFNELSDSYVIFFTRSDYLGGGLPLYHIDRVIREMSKDFDDGSHIIYVNGSYKGEDPIGMLVHDFNCKHSEDMCYDLLKEGVHHFKSTTEGRSEMCKLVEDYAKDLAKDLVEDYAKDLAKDLAKDYAKERAEEIAHNLISTGKMSFEEISTVTGLSIETITTLANGQPA